jgi:hypothetical protein
MAWTGLTFTSSLILQSSQMNAVQANFTAVASYASGAPRVTNINRAWVTFEADGTIRSSEGVSSIGHTQTGEYTVNWTNTFSGFYGITFGDRTTASAADASVRGFRGFPVGAGSVVVTYGAFNNSADAKENIEGTVTAWQT